MQKNRHSAAFAAFVAFAAAGAGAGAFAFVAVGAFAAAVAFDTAAAVGEDIFAVAHAVAVAGVLRVGQEI